MIYHVGNRKAGENLFVCRNWALPFASPTPSSSPLNPVFQLMAELNLVYKWCLHVQKYRVPDINPRSLRNDRWQQLQQQLFRQIHTKSV